MLMIINLIYSVSPYFEVVKCPAIQATFNGTISPPHCLKRPGVNYGTKCFIFCNTTEGYELEGPSNVTCLEDGSWSADISKTSCKGMLVFDRGEHM